MTGSKCRRTPTESNGAKACPRCGRLMKLTAVNAHERYINLRIECFECDSCGENNEVIVKFE